MCTITKEQKEQLQQELITHCDTLPEDLIDTLCQVVTDYGKPGSIKLSKVYKYAELSDEAKEKAIENLCDINVDGDWWFESTYEDAKTIAALMGITIDKIYFSGFSSQGDGACFEGSYTYTSDIVRKIKEYAPNRYKTA